MRSWTDYILVTYSRLFRNVAVQDARHNTDHYLVFWAGQGTGTVSLDANLFPQLTAMREAVLFEVFLGIWKACDVLDRERSLDLLTAYGIGPRTVQLLRKYWNQLTMVDKANGYFRRPLKGYQGVTQGDPLSPTIFNVVVDSFIRHWVTVVTLSEAGTGGIIMKIIDMAAYFYSEDILVASTQPERLQREFEILASLFDRVCL